MGYVPVKRATLLIPSGPSHDEERKHLFVICTDACADGGHVIVPICKLTNHLCDQTCILQSHEHAFLKATSFVLYRKASIEHGDTLTLGVESGRFIVHESLNSQTFSRLWNGLSKSNQTPRKVKFYLAR